MSKRFLFLDDDEARHDSFRRQTIGTIVDHVRTAQAAIEALCALPRPYDAVFLDGDLDWQASAGLPPLSPTGEAVCDAIVFDLPRAKWPLKVVIHSLNAKRAAEMHGTLAPLRLIRPNPIPVIRAKFHGGLVNEVGA
jgi:hypothetical protein